MATEPTWQLHERVKINPEANFPASVDYSAVYVITKVPTGARQVNYTARPENAPAGARGVRGRGDCFIPADGAPASTPTARLMDYPPLINPGALAYVNLKGKRTLVVVLRITGAGETCAVTLPGGNDGHYWRNVRTAALEVIDPALLTISAA